MLRLIFFKKILLVKFVFLFLTNYFLYFTSKCCECCSSSCKIGYQSSKVTEPSKKQTNTGSDNNKENNKNIENIPNFSQGLEKNKEYNKDIDEAISNDTEPSKKQTETSIDNNKEKNNNIKNSPNFSKGLEKIKEINKDIDAAFIYNQDAINTNNTLITRYIIDNDINIQNAKIDRKIIATDNNKNYSHLDPKHPHLQKYEYTVEGNGIRKNFITKDISGLYYNNENKNINYISTLLDILRLLDLFELKYKYEPYCNNEKGILLLETNFDKNQIMSNYFNNNEDANYNDFFLFENARVFYFFSSLLGLRNYSNLIDNTNIYVKDDNLKFIFAEYPREISEQNFNIDKNNKSYFLIDFFYDDIDCDSYGYKYTAYLNTSRFLLYKNISDLELNLLAITMILHHCRPYFTTRTLDENPTLKKRLNILNTNYFSNLGPMQRINIGVFTDDETKYEDIKKILLDKLKINLQYNCYTHDEFYITKILQSFYNNNNCKNINDFIEKFCNFLNNNKDKFKIQNDIKNIKNFFINNLENTKKIINAEIKYTENKYGNILKLLMSFTNEENEKKKKKIKELNTYLEHQNNTSDDRATLELIKRIKDRIDIVKKSGVFKNFFS